LIDTVPDTVFMYKLILMMKPYINIYANYEYGCCTYNYTI
jgi:hypothetical protein